MSESSDPARERAFALYEASGGAITTGAILAHLHAEGHTHVRLKTLSAWKTRDRWRARCPESTKTDAQKIVQLQKFLLGPKIERLENRDQVERLDCASIDLLETTITLAGKLRTRVDALQPDDIEVRSIAPLATAVGNMLAHCAALDAEVKRRKAEIGALSPPSGPIVEHEAISPAQEAVRRLAEMKLKRKG